MIVIICAKVGGYTWAWVSTEKINVRSPLGSKIDKPNKNQKSTFLVKMPLLMNANCIVLTQKQVNLCDWYL